MTKPKYAIGDRINGTPFYVRGRMTPSNGDHRYFLQIAQTDNTFVRSETDLESMIDEVQNKLLRHFKLST